MKSKFVLVFCPLIFMISCKSNNKQIQKDQVVKSDLETEVVIEKPEIKKELLLDFDFKIAMGDEEDFESFKTYTYFELSKNNQIIYIDSSLVEYEFGDKLYPIILQTGNNKYELLFEINDRPNKNYLKRFFVKENKIYGQDKLPTFISKAKDLNYDGVKEYAGFWDYGEMWDGDSTVYNPILYYSLTESGLKLDSALTKDRNKYIYGQFYGFEYNEKFAQPISVSERLEKEINRIKRENR